MIPLNSLTSKNLCFLQHCGLSHVIRVIGNYVLKFPNFRCHHNKGPSEIYRNDTVKLPDFENPLFGATSSAPALVLATF